jgi:hypothetical protein
MMILDVCQKWRTALVSNWKDEDIATPELMKEYLEEFKTSIACNTAIELNEDEKSKVQASLQAMENFSNGLLTGGKKLYMHDIILMAIGYYGGYLTALDAESDKKAAEKKD